MTIDEMIAVLKAYKDGKEIEAKASDGSSAWMGHPRPSWDFYRHDYRIKREPRDWWIGVDHEGNIFAFKKERQNDKSNFVHVREVLDD